MRRRRHDLCSPEAFFRVDRAWRIQDASLQGGEGAPLGDDVRLYLPPAVCAHVEQAALDAMASGMPAIVDGVDDARRSWVVHVLPMRDGLAIHIRDATLQRRDRERMQSLLEERTNELEVMSSTMSHDLRTPLRAVGGFGDLLAMRHSAGLDARGREALQNVRTGARRMGRLVDDMLALSHLRDMRLERAAIDVSTLAHDIITTHRSTSPARSVESHVQPGMSAHADAQMVRILLEKLIDNAWKFTARTPGARIEVSRGEEAASFLVADNGIGFDMAYAGKLFKPFERLHSEAQFEGNGTGLAAVARIVQRHGGRAWANSEPDHGARITFTLGPA